MRSHRNHIGINCDVDLARLARFQIVKIQRAKLLIDNGIVADGCRLYIEAIIADQLLGLLRDSVISEERNGAATIREKVDLVTTPHGIEFVGIVAWQLFNAGVTEIANPDGRRHAAPIVLPRIEAVRQRYVSQVSSVWRVCAFISHW